MPITPAHLGGHLNKTHIDEGAFVELCDHYNIKTMLDIGCGPGGMRDVARKYEVQWFGIDGDPIFSDKPDMIIHDFATGPLPEGKPYYNLGWSVEFIEHVEEQFFPNVLSAFKKCSILVMTHALPGETGGHHHVNLKSEKEWIDLMENNDFAHIEPWTDRIRACSTMQKGFMRKTGKIFFNLDQRDY